MHNVGKIDRIVRVIVAAILLTLYFTHVIQYQAVLFIAALLVMTSLRQCCPLYSVLGFGTCGVKPEKNDRVIETDPMNLKK